MVNAQLASLHCLSYWYNMKNLTTAPVRHAKSLHSQTRQVMFRFQTCVDKTDKESNILSTYKLCMICWLSRNFYRVTLCVWSRLRSVVKALRRVSHKLQFMSVDLICNVTPSWLTLSSLVSSLPSTFDRLRFVVLINNTRKQDPVRQNYFTLHVYAIQTASMHVV